MQKKGKTVLTVCSAVLLCIAVGGLFFHGHNMEKQTSAEAVKMNQHLNVEKNFDNTQHAKAESKLFGHALTSKDPTIKSIAINKDDNNSIHKPFLKFFNVFYNWRTHDEYVKRPKELRAVATPKVLGNKKFFDKDQDTSNGSIIENEQLNSEFNDMNLYVLGHKGTNIDVLADVQYNSWKTEDDNQVTGEKWFDMNYNTKQQKITSMKPIYRQNNVNNDNA